MIPATSALSDTLRRADRHGFATDAAACSGASF
jgi:hypothetical protein